MPFEFSWGQFLAHLGYANALIGYSWYNPVFWTLAIEFQWYLLAALLYPLFTSLSAWKRWLVFAGFACLSYVITSGSLLFHYLPVFALGVATFQYRAGLIRNSEYGFLLLAFAVISGLVLGSKVGVTGLVTGLAISFLRLQQRWLLTLGALSYSLYLLHVPIGGRVINLGARLPNSIWAKLATLGLAMMVSLGAAFLLWKFVERPALRWAGKISSGQKTKEL